MVQAHFRHQALEAGPLVSAGARPAQVLVDDQHAVGGPAQCLCAVHQAILQPRRLLVSEHLLDGGLAHIDDGQPIAMPGSPLLGVERSAPRASDGQERRHGRPPRRAPAMAAVAAPGGGSGAPAAAGGGLAAGAPSDCSPRSDWAGGNEADGWTRHGSAPSACREPCAARTRSAASTRRSNPVSPISAARGPAIDSWASRVVWLGSLADPAYLIEIEAVAVLT